MPSDEKKCKCKHLGAFTATIRDGYFYCPSCGGQCGKVGSNQMPNDGGAEKEQTDEQRCTAELIEIIADARHADADDVFLEFWTPHVKSMLAVVRQFPQVVAKVCPECDGEGSLEAIDHVNDCVAGIYDCPTCDKRCVVARTGGK